MAVDRSDAPEASVVIAAYQAEASIARAVGSAFAQEDVTLEVIVVDDASGDGTSLAASSVDPRVRCIRRDKNGGPAAARNCGFRVAKGRWIAVLDADDAMAPARLRRMIDHASAKQADAVVDDLVVERHGADPVRMFGSALAGMQSLELTSYIRSNRLFKGGLQLGYAKPVFRTAFMRDHGLAYDEALRIGEDYRLMADCLAAGGRVVVLDEALYHYRQHSGSTSFRIRVDHIAALQGSDRRFATRWSLDPEVRAALGLRDAAFRDGAAFTQAVDALKAGQLTRAAYAVACRPSAAWEFRRPIGARVGRLKARLRRRVPLLSRGH